MLRLNMLEIVKVTIMSNDLIVDHPATATVHWPSGPVDACAQHAKKLMMLAQFMGSHAVSTKAGDGAQCSNCINEAKK